MTDPRFPRRPQHSDYWLISQALVDTDAQADMGEEGGDIMGRIVDPESLTYAAEERAKLMVRHAPLLHRQQTELAAMWVDAFVAGARFQHLKSTGAQTFKGEPGE